MNTFTDKDLITHLENFITALQNTTYDDPSFLEYVLLSCADSIDRHCPQTKRESVIDHKFMSVPVPNNVQEWVNQCSKLDYQSDNGYVHNNIYELHSDYYDWVSFTMGEKAGNIVEFVDLYKILRTLGYKVHF